MDSLIINPAKDPLGAMLVDFLNGSHDACVRVESPDLDMSHMSGHTMFRTFDQMNRIEQKALGLCRGKILDVGAGSGCHTLFLQEQSMDVTALDISLGCIQVMEKRGVNHLVHNSLYGMKPEKYDTILMLMNGIGICGSLDGLNLFFQHVRTILAPGGRIIADSTDLSVLTLPISNEPSISDEPSLTEDRNNIFDSEYNYWGETDFVMTYKDIKGDPFDWLYIDFPTLDYYANYHGFSCDLVMMDENGKFLAKIY